jgi:uncharacterized membrane protein
MSNFTPERGPDSSAPAQPLPSLRRAISSLEGGAHLDAVASRLQSIGRTLVRSKAGDLLLGRPLGHAVHPALTDLPLGAWMSAVVLDVSRVPGSRAAARRLVGFGVLAAVPSVLSGLAELAAVDRSGSRVGVVHASANAVALSLFTASYRSRRSGHDERGVALALAGAGLASWGGYLGGHLAIARDVGTRAEEYRESFRADQHPVAAADPAIQI